MSHERRNNEERRRLRREQRRRARDAARAHAPAGRSPRRLLLLFLALLALSAGTIAAGYGIAAMRAVATPADMMAP